MTENLARAHRRVAASEHAVEDRMKQIANDVEDPKAFREAAEEISERADEHLEVAERLENGDTRTDEGALDPPS